MAWDKKKYFRDRQAELRRKAKEYDKLMEEGTINPNFGKELAAERIEELENAGSRAKDMLKSAIDEQDNGGVLRALKILEDIGEKKDGSDRSNRKEAGRSNRAGERV
jgi:hypothetical protein